MKYSILCSLFQNIRQSVIMDGYIPYEPNNFDAHEYNSIYPLIRFNSATSAAPTLYHQGIISLAGNILNFIL